MALRNQKMNKRHLLRFKLQHFWVFVCFLICFGLGAAARAQVPAPLGLAQVGPYSGQVNLIWTPTPNATAYQISRQLVDLTDTVTSTPTGPVTPVPTVTPIALVPSSLFPVQAGTPAFTDFQVTDGRSYLYLVAGIDASGMPGPSAGVTALPYTVPAVVNPSVADTHNKSIDLSWGVPLSTFPIALYNIYRQTSGPITTDSMPAVLFFASTPAPIATTANTSYTDQTASSAVSNYYAVVAVDSQSMPATGLFPSFSTNGVIANTALPPVAPVLFGFIPVAGYGTVVPTATPVYGVQLIWNGPVINENVTNYLIYANGAGIGVVNVATVLPTYVYSIYTTPTPTGTFNTSTITNTPTVTSTFTSSFTPTFTSSPTGTLTPTYSPTITPTPTISGTFTPTFVPYSLLPGVLTNYSIVAINANGAVTSNSISEEIVPPSLSGAVTVTPNATPNSYTLTWSQGVTGTYGFITQYQVYRGISGIPVPYATVGAGTPTTNTPTPITIVWQTPSRTPTVMAVDTVVNSNGYDYTYWVQPVDAIGLGGRDSRLNTANKPWAHACYRGYGFTG